MYLKTPKRYSAKRRRRNLFNLTWLWLYLLAPVVIIAAALAWDLRAPLSKGILDWTNKNVKPPQLFAPTPTPTLPAKDLEVRIQTLLENGSINDAMDAMKAYTESMPNDQTWYPTLAEMMIMRNPNDPGTRQTAFQTAVQALNASPESSAGYAVLALVLDWSDQTQRALGYALRAKDLGDANGLGAAAMAGIYVSLNDFTTAGKLTDEALKQNPNLAYAYFVKGQIAQYSGDRKGALQFYKQALAISDNDRRQWGGYIVLAIAGVYRAQNDLDPAVSILIGSIPRDKDYPALYGTLADIYFQRGDYVKALETALSCIDRNPNYSYCYVIATKVQYNDGAYEKAAQAAERAAELGSQETSVYYYGGEAYYKMNRCPDAIKLLGEGVKLAAKLNKETARSEFVEALGRCGVTAEVQILPTATPFLVTATPRPR